MAQYSLFEYSVLALTTAEAAARRSVGKPTFAWDADPRNRPHTPLLAAPTPTPYSIQYSLFNMRYLIFNWPMSDLLDRLTAPLADRYNIEHELGAGGMGHRSRRRRQMNADNTR